MKKSTKKVVIIICCVLAVALIAGGTVVGVNVYNKNVKEQQIEQILSDIKGKYDTFVNESDRDKRIIIIKNLENDLTDYLKNNEPVEKIKEEYQSDLEQMKSYFVTYYEKVISDNTLNEVEKITDKTLQSIRTHGWLPDMFQQIIRGAKDFLQEMIFKFKLPPKPVPKIDLQEWNDMRKLMEKLQKQSQAMKSTQQEISSLKKQLSETTGFFKGKARKSLEGKIEQSEKQEKRIHTDMEQTVKQAGYPDVQSFAKTYQKSEKLVREYNEELRAWKNQTEPKKEKLSEPSKKASIREKLHRYQQESRQQPKQTAKKKSMDRGR